MLQVMTGKQQQLYRILHHHLDSSSSSNSCRSFARSLTTARRPSQLPIQSPDQSHRRCVLASPWSATQLRGAKFRGSNVKPGNVIERKGTLYQVVKENHTVQGRGGACIQVVHSSANDPELMEDPSFSFSMS